MALEPRTQVEVDGRRGRQDVGARLGALPALVVVVVGSLAIACAPSAAQKIEADLASVQKEANAATLVERGKAFAALGDYTRAEEYLATSIDAGADPRDVLPLLMDVCVKTGRYRSAIQHAENHLRKFPRDARTRLMVGALYAAINEGDHAREQLERVVNGASDGARSTPDAGDGASAFARRTARLEAHAHYLLAVVARDSDNDAVGADRHFREYLRMEPTGAHAEEARASLLKRLAAEPASAAGDAGDAGDAPVAIPSPLPAEGASDDDSPDGGAR